MSRLNNHSFKKVPSRLDRKGSKKKRLKQVGMILLLLALGSSLFFIWFFDVVPTVYMGFRDSLGNSAKKYGLYVENVVVRGRKETSLNDIRNCLGKIQGKPILNVDIQEINRCLSQLPWVKAITLGKRYPQDIEILIHEKKPMALWQHNKIIHVVAEDGSIVQSQPRESFSNLPTIVGKGAPEHTPALLHILNEFPQISDQVASSIRVSNRRWNLLLKNGITIRLPETDTLKALQQLDEFITQYGLNAKNIKSIDFRVPGRLALSMTKEGILKFQKNNKGNMKRSNA